ncbi:MAG: sterol desaturase family protein [Flavobacteriaceae bacterium]
MEDNNKILWIVMAVVLAVVGIEYLIAKKMGKNVYRFQNTISNLTMGAFDRAAGLLMVPFIYFWFDFLYKNLAIFTIPETKYYFIGAVIISDFLWYIYHTAGHKINLFWGAHIIHHQSEDYNYTVALNLTPFQVVVRIMVWSAMPILGFSASVVLGTHLVIGLYQFLLHTTLIPKLGIIEKFMVTPSHHRVHHGSNEEYLDKNFGGIFIIWDRFFGTFQEEIAPVAFGITKDINTRDFTPSVFHYYQTLMLQTKQLPNVKEKFLLWFKGPDWVPNSGALKIPKRYIEKDTYNYNKLSKPNRLIIGFSVVFLFLLLAETAYIMSDISVNYVYGLIGFLILTMVIIGRRLENKNVLILESIKYLGLAVLFYLIYV